MLANEEKTKQIRLLNVIADERLGGPATHILQVAKRLQEENFHVVVAMPEGERTAARLFDEAGISCYQLRTFKKLPRKVNIIIGFHWVLHWLFYFVPGMVSLIRLIKKERIEVVRANGIMSLQVPLAARLAGARLIWHLNDIITPGWLKALLLSFLHWLPERITADSKAVVRYYLGEKGLSASNVAVLYPSVDTNKFRPDSDVRRCRQEFGIGEDEKVVGVVAHFNPSKGYEYFVPAADLIKQKFPRVKFLVIGKELETQRKYAQQLYSLIDRFHLKDDFILTGQRLDVPQLMNVMDVFVLSSISETFSQVTGEAMACAKPVVATRVGGVPEVVGEDGAGILVAPRKPEAIAEAVLHLLNHPEEAREMGLRGRQRVMKLFSLERCIQEHKELYQKLLG